MSNLTAEQRLQLQSELAKPEYQPLGDAAAATAAFGQIRRVLDIPTEVTPYLIANGLSAKLAIAVRRSDTPDEVVGAISDAQTTYTTQPKLDMELQIFQDGLELLVTNNVWTRKEADAFDAQSYVAITAEDVRAVRNAAAIENAQALEEQLGTAYGAALAVVQQAKAALVAGTSTEAPAKEQLLDAFTGAFA